MAIVGGSEHSLALKSDGTVWAWGSGYSGQLGDGNFYTTGNRGVATPVQVSGLTTVTAIAGGGAHSLALPAVAANTPPVITCPADVNVPNDPSQCSAVVNYPAPSTIGGTGNVVVVCNPPSDSVFPVGTTMVTCTATDASGSTAACSFNVTVQAITSLTATPSLLRPINNFLAPVRLDVVATENCGPATCQIISVTSSDPIIPMPSGRLEPYWLITGNLSLYLRAGRNTPDVARNYTITIECTDTAGNTSTKTVDVVVPK